MRLTIIVGTDVQATCLTTGNGLGQTEECRSEGSDAFAFQDLGSVERHTGGGDLDAVSIFRDSGPFKLFRVHSPVGDDSRRIVRF